MQRNSHVSPKSSDRRAFSSRPSFRAGYEVQRRRKQTTPCALVKGKLRYAAMFRWGSSEAMPW